jgi:hypothetical protein
MAKVTPVKWGITPKDQGEFHCESFNLFEPDEVRLYEQLRTDASNAANGIKIEHIREYARKKTTREGEGEELIVTTTEDIIVVVQYWQKRSEKQGDTDGEVDEARQAWHREGATSG